MVADYLVRTEQLLLRTLDSCDGDTSLFAYRFCGTWSAAATARHDQL